jgi:hypothetical protein
MFGKDMQSKVFIGLLILILVGTTIAFFTIDKNHQLALTKMQEEYRIAREEDNKLLISGLYSLHKKADEYAPPREVRLKNFTEKAKGYMLQKKTNFKDWEINEFVAIIFEQSEARSISPLIPLAFASVESQFHKKQRSVETEYLGKAKGVFQIVDITARAMLGENYYDNCQDNYVIATKIWFKYWDLLSSIVDNETFEDKLQWVAVGYHCGEIVLAKLYDSGMKPKDAYQFYITGGRDGKVRQLADKDYIDKVDKEYQNLYTIFGK